MRLPAPIPAALILAASLAAGCATSGPSENAYGPSLAKLESDCSARNGILVASGVATARPETDYYCRLNTATRIPGA